MRPTGRRRARHTRDRPTSRVRRRPGRPRVQPRASRAPAARRWRASASACVSNSTTGADAGPGGGGTGAAYARSVPRLRRRGRRRRKNDDMSDTGAGDTDDTASEVARACSLLAHARRVVVLTGAGISTDSGIPDFRGPQGVWTKNPEAEKMATLQAYVSDPELRQRSWQNRLDLAHVGLGAQRRARRPGGPRTQRPARHACHAEHRRAAPESGHRPGADGRDPRERPRRGVPALRRPPARRAGARAGARRRSRPRLHGGRPRRRGVRRHPEVGDDQLRPEPGP